MSNIMRDYELVLITVPQLEEEALATLIQRVTGWIAAGNGTVTGTNVWGRRNLAYAIRKLTEGIYVVLNFQLDPSSTTRASIATCGWMSRSSVTWPSDSTRTDHRPR